MIANEPQGKRPADDPVIDRDPALQPEDTADNPFATFAEWHSEADTRAYAAL